MKIMKGSLPVILAVWTLGTPLSTVFAQGALTPPGAPSPSMKTLTQIEPRTPISSLPFVITNSGSYYLTTNLVNNNSGAGFCGIAITNGVGDVALDLNGFDLVDTATGMVQYGIRAWGNNVNLVVCNGALRNWTSAGIYFSAANGGRIEKVICTGTGAFGNFPGIEVGSGFQVINCQCLSCAYGYSSDTGDNSFAHCAASLCSQVGFSITSSNTTFVDCQSHDNLGSGFTTTAPASKNSFLNCSANYNGVFGFNLGASTNTVIQGCSAKNNQFGIQTAAGSDVLNNQSTFNATHGFYITGTGSRVEGNSAINNAGTTGFNFTGTGNLIIKNTSRGATTAFNIPSGNSSGPVVDVLNSGNGTNNITSSPWANFSY